MVIHFFKYHALGNDYLVLDPAEVPAEELTPDRVQALCHRHYGVGSDGILWGPGESASCDFGLRIFNPDGGEAEKSGNGLRIFSRYLADRGLVDDAVFSIETLGGRVTARVHETRELVSVDMGQVRFTAVDIPVQGEQGEVLQRSMTAGGRELTYCAATVGNPHCIVLCEEISEDLARELGPVLEVAPCFPRRANVQFLKVVDRAHIALEIWERGAGYTLACGSAASAGAATVRRLDLCDPQIRVHMPGGHLDITVAPDYTVSLTGPVTRVAEGTVFPELFAGVGP